MNIVASFSSPSTVDANRKGYWNFDSLYRNAEAFSLDRRHELFGFITISDGSDREFIAAISDNDICLLIDL